MKLVFRTTPSLDQQRISQVNRSSPFLLSGGSGTINGNANNISFVGSIFDRIRTSGAPCGSCGGR